MTNPGPIVQRPATSRFVPREKTPAPETTIVQRNVMQPSKKQGAGLTKRQRIIAGDLPDWEPLPPGEIVVNRPGQ